MKATCECSVDGCARPCAARGWCQKHYNRWRAHGDPTFPWRLDVVDYAGAHVRVRKLRGPARLLSCVECGGAATEWAYDNADPEELLGDNHGLQCAYSLDPTHYVPMCRSCHRTFDVSHSVASGRWVGRGRTKNPLTHCSRGHEFTAENIYWPPGGGRRQCRACIRLRTIKRTLAQRDQRREARFI